MFIIIPYHVDVPMACRPWMNWLLIGLTILCYPLFGVDFALGMSDLGWMTHLVTHLDLLHLLGNMLFLWVFGNAVCAKVGNGAYLLIYVGLGLLSGLVSYAIDPRPSTGASGAINGIVGMFVVWYLWNELSCWYAYWLPSFAGAGSFSVSSYWLVLLWAAFDLWGLIQGESNVDYLAHLSGLAAGFSLAIVLLLTRWVEMERDEHSLLQAFASDEA